eukprot:TRINITY_DN1142_c0_g1_i2.p1 TRINITY_DN1142_c0_g1~~TRINITY_DN1142_c0_g1_i2.p1  ORF type:complete len:264 (-),score=46.58 TRINITY_DN1142_c0_g1_i2:517-1308(-)
MGKYMRKGKGVAVMEVSSQSVSLGGRNRARAVASQKSQHKRLLTRSSSAKQQHYTCYMELRSRRLEKVLPSCSCYHEMESNKPEILAEASVNDTVSDEGTLLGSSSSFEQPKQQQQQQYSVAHSRNNSATFSRVQSNIKPAKTHRKEAENGDAKTLIGGEGLEVEASFGENIIDLDSKERKTRERTPSSHIRDMETEETPGSTTKRPPPTRRRRLQQQRQQESEEVIRHGRINNRYIHVPTSNEIEEFFARAELQEQRKFTER